MADSAPSRPWGDRFRFESIGISGLGFKRFRGIRSLGFRGLG